MTNRFNRLEKLFSKRKASVPADEPLSPVSSIHDSEPQFPSPSFIRPKGSRMAAREDVRAKQSPTKSPSVPDLLMAQRTNSVHTRNSGSTSNSFRQKLSPAKSATFRPPQDDPFTSGLDEFRFPEPPSYNGDTSPLSLTFSSKSTETHHQHSPRSRSPLDLSNVPSRVDTPPSSDPGDEDFSSHYHTKKLPPIPPPTRAPPTPGDSPDLGPIPDSKLKHSKSFEVPGHALYKPVVRRFGEPLQECVLRRSRSQVSVMPTSRVSRCSSTLREPDVDEFLELSDDDIAEMEPKTPNPPPPWDQPPFLPAAPFLMPPTGPRMPPFLTLAPPVPSNASTAAAFEAARIANRNDFDLVYVVNLWPATGWDSQRPTTPVSIAASHNSTDAQSSLTGRLLAAYGLHNVPSPLQISAGVHRKILRSDGWVEYCNHEAQPADLARGYACAFYPGEYPRSGSPDTNAPVSGVRLSERIDRGIVFAAFRRPRADENKLGPALQKNELGNLHQDAEALVEMLIDIHTTSQLRRARSQDLYSDNIGPIPTSVNTD